MTAPTPNTCPNCRSDNPNIVGVMKATGADCTDPFHCPSPDIHGNPFRYCPHCSWVEAWEAKAGTVTVRVLTFDTEDDLREHALQLNEHGKTPNVSIMDANGNAVLACVAGCYADEFHYYSPGEDGYMHPEGCCECESERSDWKPRFPVTALAVSSRFPD